MFKRLFPIILALILLGAHFSRNSYNLLAMVSVLLPFLLFVKRMWVIHLLQGTVFLGGLSWAISTYTLVMGRISFGQPWTRLFIILFIVTLFTFWAGYWVKGPKVIEKYK
ncbi:MAG: hypothetical protein D8M58_05305 [Calditrichaeota bacterium]|nr:MAG: hypothetical protein DWQ03_21200 [Calditrichota bacterium]MBL1204792.1 hypothetical protein [Calditrichota bacterium]NOG44621.1 hypothetical protein [Calditrichota bacterium]